MTQSSVIKAKTERASSTWNTQFNYSTHLKYLLTKVLVYYKHFFNFTNFICCAIILKLMLIFKRLVIHYNEDRNQKFDNGGYNNYSYKYLSVKLNYQVLFMYVWGEIKSLNNCNKWQKHLTAEFVVLRRYKGPF
jgi:hypothetical protein